MNLSTEGTFDWLNHIATPGNALRMLNPVPNSKKWGGHLLLGFDWIPLNGTAFTQNCNFTKTSTASDSVQGLALNSVVGAGFFHATNVGYGWRMTMPSDRGSYTLKIYTEHFAATVTVTATLTDGSEGTQTLTHNSGASTTVTNCWTIQFTSQERCELAVSVILTTRTDSTPNLKFIAATLSQDSTVQYEPDFTSGIAYGITQGLQDQSADDPEVIYLPASTPSAAPASARSDFLSGMAYAQSEEADESAGDSPIITSAADSVSAVGEILSIAGSTARWTPVIALIDLRGSSMWIVLYVGNNWTTIYDPINGWVPWFNQRSSVEASGDNFLVTVLPNGGWSSSEFDLKFLSGGEMVLAEPE